MKITKHEQPPTYTIEVSDNERQLLRLACAHEAGYLQQQSDSAQTLGRMAALSLEATDTRALADALRA